MVGWMARLAETLGLDWLRILVNRPVFEEPESPFPSRSEIEAKFSTLTDKKLEDALEFCSALVKREDNRADKVESKAVTLIGITGIATAFITGFASLLLDRSKISIGLFLTLAALLYIVVVLSFLFTIFLAMTVIKTLDYQFGYPDPKDILGLADSSLDTIKRNRAIDLFCSFARNSQLVNRKGTYLGGAQLWFRNSMALLVVLTLSLSLFAIINTSVSKPPVFRYISNRRTLGLLSQATPTPLPIPTSVVPTITMRTTLAATGPHCPIKLPTPTR